MFLFYNYWLDCMREFAKLGMMPYGFAVAPQPAPEPAPSPQASTTPKSTITLGAVIDPAREKALSDALAKAQAALKASEARSAAFLSSMSHELRTPLNAIMGFADMMRTGVFGPLGNTTYEQYVEDIHASGAALLTKIDDLIGLACMDANDHEMTPSKIALTAFLQELALEHGTEASARGLLLRADCGHGIEIEADPDHLAAALSHLIGNALRHAKEGSEVLISARVQPGEGLIVSIRDSGDGIGEGKLATIRAALQQSGSYHAIATDGIGLGLSVAHELARRHGGRIMIDSVRKRGTVASLILPPERVTAGMKKKPATGLKLQTGKRR